MLNTTRMLTVIGLLALALCGIVSGDAQAQIFHVSRNSSPQPLVLAPGDWIQVDLPELRYLSNPTDLPGDDQYRHYGQYGVVPPPEFSYTWRTWREDAYPPQLEFMARSHGQVYAQRNPKPFGITAMRRVTFVFRVRDNANLRGLARMRFTQLELISHSVDRSFDIRIQIRSRT
jgi:hypothetical protein